MANPLDPDGLKAQMDALNTLALGPLYVPGNALIGAGAGTQQYGNVAPMGSIAPQRLTGAQPSEPGFVYHATNAERLQDIADSGKLLTHRPSEFTEQDAWPDGSTQKRNYFTPSAQNTWQFAPEEGAGALLRLQRDAHPIQAERGTGDLYSTKPVPSDALEYLGTDGAWHPVTDLKSGQ